MMDFILDVIIMEFGIINLKIQVKIEPSLKEN